jgi:hypothetical protein
MNIAETIERLRDLRAQLRELQRQAANNSRREKLKRQRPESVYGKLTMDAVDVAQVPCDNRRAEKAYELLGRLNNPFLEAQLVSRGFRPCGHGWRKPARSSACS